MSARDGEAVRAIAATEHAGERDGALRRLAHDKTIAHLKAVVSQREAAEFVVDVWIDAGLVEDDVGAERVEDRREFGGEDGEVGGVGGAVGERHVAVGGLFADREVFLGVHREGEGAWFVREECCGAIALVDIEINDEDAARIGFGEQPRRGDGEIVQHAVARPCIVQRVVRAACSVRGVAMCEREARGEVGAACREDRAARDARRDGKADTAFDRAIDRGGEDGGDISGGVDRLHPCARDRFGRVLRECGAALGEGIDQQPVFAHRKAVIGRQFGDVIGVVDERDLHGVADRTAACVARGLSLAVLPVQYGAKAMWRWGWLILGLALVAGLPATAAPFDPEAATRAYLATIHGAARAKSDAYFEGGYWLTLWDAVVAVAVNLLLLATGGAARIAAWAGRRRRSLAGRTLLFSMAYILLTALLTLPWDVWEGFFREHQYGLSNQDMGQFLGDAAKKTGLGVVLGAAILVPIMLLVRRTRVWWVWGTGVVIAGFAFLALAAPVVILPLFNKYTPLAQSPLRAQILSLARANGIPATDVFVVDASRQTKKISANVAGLAGTTRIALNDNLFATHDPDMIRAVLGHEMGHYVLDHVVTGLIEGGLVILGGFAAVRFGVAALLRRYGARWGVQRMDDPAVIPAAAIVFALYGLAMTPVNNTITRVQEAQADIFGLNAARAPDGFARAALALSQYRKLEPTKIEEAVFYDHPSGRTRIAAAMRWKAEHLGETDVR